MKWKVFRNSRSGVREATKHTMQDKAHIFCHDPHNCECICTLCKHAARRVRKERP